MSSQVPERHDDDSIDRLLTQIGQDLWPDDWRTRVERMAGEPAAQEGREASQPSNDVVIEIGPWLDRPSGPPPRPSQATFPPPPLPQSRETEFAAAGSMQPVSGSPAQNHPGRTSKAPIVLGIAATLLVLLVSATALATAGLVNRSNPPTDSVGVDAFAPNTQTTNTPPTGETPNDAEAFRDQGDTHFNLGEYERAVEDYNQAIAVDPNNAVTLANRGAANFNRGDYERAVDDYNQAIALTESGEASRPIPDLDVVRQARDEAAALSPLTDGADG